MNDLNRNLHKETGLAWDITASIYERDEKEDITCLLKGEISLYPVEQQILKSLRSWCNRAIHLQCAGGTDTLSLLNMGAQEVIGIDISEKMIDVAKRKTAALEAKAGWYCCDILDTPSSLNNTADLVYTGKGALPWIMDIQAWAHVVTRLLKPGGVLYIFEGHPLDWVWDMSASTYKLSTKTGNYFSKKIATDRGWPLDSVAIQNHKNKNQFHVHEHQWTLGDIMNNLINSGLRLIEFEEHPEVFWDQFPNIPDEVLSRLPHTFSLLMKKE